MQIYSYIPDFSMKNQKRSKSRKGKECGEGVIYPTHSHNQDEKQ